MEIRLRVLRESRGYKVAQMVQRLGVQDSRYRKWESNSAQIPLEFACRCADILHCTLDELAGRRVPEGPSYSDPRQQEANEIWDHVNESYRTQMWEHAKVIDMAYDKSTQRNSVQEVAV